VTNILIGGANGIRNYNGAWVESPQWPRTLHQPPFYRILLQFANAARTNARRVHEECLPNCSLIELPLVALSGNQWFDDLLGRLEHVLPARITQARSIVGTNPPTSLPSITCRSELRLNGSGRSLEGSIQTTLIRASKNDCPAGTGRGNYERFCLIPVDSRIDHLLLDK